MSALAKLAEMKAKATGLDAVRADYKAFRAMRLAEGWSDRDITEFDEMIRIDFADGAGVQRPFETSKAMRIELWGAYFAEQIITPATGINERIRASIAEERKAA
jgi:hypothetical protein